MQLITVTAILLQGVVTYATAQLFTGFGGGSGSSVQCTTTSTQNGKYKVVCQGPNASPPLRSEHILWLQGGAGANYLVDIEVPNYKLQELIKAGFKPSQSRGPLINVLLKRPEQTYDAQVGRDESPAGVPQVKLEYEPVQKLLVHYPNDKQYSPLTGPILPPPAQSFGQSSTAAVSEGRNFQIDPRVGRNFPKRK